MVRPDSGDPPVIVPQLLDLLGVGLAERRRRVAVRFRCGELARRALVRRLRHSRHLQFAILEVLHQTTQRLRLRGVAPDALELLPRPGGDERAAAVGVQGAAQAHAREPLVEGLGDAERRVVLLLAFPRVHLGIHGRRRRGLRPAHVAHCWIR